MNNIEMLRSVAHILAIDGEINQQERYFLNNLGKGLHLSDNDLTDILEHTNTHEGTINIPHTAGEKTLLFSMLIHAAATDAVISPQEREILQDVGARIGMTRDEISRAIASAEVSFSQPSHDRDGDRRKQPTGSRSLISKHINSRTIGAICLGIIALIFSVIGGVAFSNSVLRLPPALLKQLFPGGITTVIIDPPNYTPKPIEKLFTAFAFMPIVDYKYNYHGVDLMGRFFDDVSKKVLKGYCVRQYEVGIGYDSIKDLFDEYQDVACHGEFQQMPIPRILSTNPIRTETQGAYTLSECTLWDAAPATFSEERKSHAQLREELKLTGQWAVITENSQKMLMSYMRIYCKLE